MEIWEFIFLNFRIKRKQHLSTLLLCWKRYYLYHVSSLRSDYLRIWYCKNFVFKARAGYHPFWPKERSLWPLLLFLLFESYVYRQPQMCPNKPWLEEGTGSSFSVPLHRWLDHANNYFSFISVCNSPFIIWPFSNKITPKTKSNQHKNLWIYCWIIRSTWTWRRTISVVRVVSTVVVRVAMCMPANIVELDHLIDDLVPLYLSFCWLPYPTHLKFYFDLHSKTKVK